MFASFAVCPLGRVASRRAVRRYGPCHADLRFGRVARVPCVALCHGQVVWVPLCRGDLRLGRVACVAWVALCHGDCCRACRVGGAVPWGSARACRVCGVSGAVPWGLLLGVSRRWRWAMGIGGAVPYGDCWWACRMCGAVPWGLLLGVSRGWRCAMGIAGGRVA